VTIELRNVPLEKALAENIKNQPLVFDIQGQTIVISAETYNPYPSGRGYLLPPLEPSYRHSWPGSK